MLLEFKDRLEIIRLEMQLIQTTLDKYDDLIFRSRNWFITLWAGTIALSFTQPSLSPLFALLLAILFWIIEGLMRHQYWFKYVLRYRVIRNAVNNDQIKDLSLYDLTNSLSEIEINELEKIKRCFFKFEPTMVYLLLGLSAILVSLS